MRIFFFFAFLVYDSFEYTIQVMRVWTKISGFSFSNYKKVIVAEYDFEEAIFCSLQFKAVFLVIVLISNWNENFEL